MAVVTLNGLVVEPPLSDCQRNLSGMGYGCGSNLANASTAWFKKGCQRQLGSITGSRLELRILVVACREKEFV